MDEHIITIRDTWHHWWMKIDLKAVARDAGRKVKDEDGDYIAYPLPRAKKLLKLIRQFGSDKDFEACDRYLAQNAKLYKYWKELRG